VSLSINFISSFLFWVISPFPPTLFLILLPTAPRHFITLGNKLTTHYSWVLSLANKLQCKQIRHNILRSSCLFIRRKVKSNETLDNYQKRVQQLYFHYLITKTLLTYKYKLFWRLKARVLKENILSSKNHHYIQSSSQTNKLQLSHCIFDQYQEFVHLNLKHELRSLWG